MSWHANPHDDFGWQNPINLADINSNAFDAAASPLMACSSSHGRKDATDCRALLFFTSGRPGGLGGPDIYVAEVASDGMFQVPILVMELSSPDFDNRPSVRFDGLEMFLESNRVGSLEPSDSWSSERGDVEEPWSLPVNLGPTVNTEHVERQPFIAADRESLYFSSNRPGGQGSFDLYVTRRAKR